MGLNIISNYSIGLCLLYIPIYTCTSIYTYIHMVYYLLGRSDNTENTFDIVSGTRRVSLLSQGNTGWVVTNRYLLVKRREKCA